MRKIGVALTVAAYALLTYSALAAPRHHPQDAHSQFDAATYAAYWSPWPIALTCGLGLMGIMLALIPVRRGEAWAVWTSLVALGILVIARFSNDPRCLVVLDPHQHGCHTFVIAMVLGVVGLVIAGL